VGFTCSLPLRSYLTCDRLFGYDLGFMGGLTTSPEFLATFGNPDPTLLGFLVSSYEIGALFGAVFVFLLGDRYGRKPTKLSGAGVISIGAVIQSTSFGVGQFLAGRIIAGFGLGMMTSVIPIWLAECAAPKSRGRMIAMQLSNLIMGLIIANWLDYGMASYPSSVQWRFPCAFQIAFCICIACLVPFLPESPRYLAKTGKLSLAINSLAALRGMHQDDPELQQEMKDIEYIVEVEQREEGTWSDVFKDGGVSGSTRVLIACVANALQQLTGSNVMSSFGPYIFQKSIGMTRHQALLVSGGLQVFFFVSSIIPWFIIDRVGRRRLFLFGSTGLALCMALSAVFVGVKGNKSLGYGAAVMLYLYQTCFTVGWMSNMWVCKLHLLLPHGTVVLTAGFRSFGTPAPQTSSTWSCTLCRVPMACHFPCCRDRPIDDQQYWIQVIRRLCSHQCGYYPDRLFLLCRNCWPSS
jgi:sugar porter (SP) family MFS transporter